MFLYFFFFAFLILSVCRCRPPIEVHVGILLTENASIPYDMRYVRPALEVAFAISLSDYNVKYVPMWISYDSGCQQSKALGHSAILALSDNIDLVIGPGCSDDLVIVCELTTYFQVPIITGAGEWVDSTFMYPYLIRASFSSYSLWRIFVKMMDYYKWTNIVIISDCCDYPKNVTTRGFVNILSDKGIVPSKEIRFKSQSLNDSSVIDGYMTDASKYARIFLLSMNSDLLRRFMLSANRLGQCEGEYVFVAVDLYQNDIVGTGKHGWSRNDSQDDDAKHAYRALFILTLMDKSSTPAYQLFQRNLKAQTAKYKRLQSVDANYHNRAFHDVTIMFAAAVNLTLGQRYNVSRNFTVPFTQMFWGQPFDNRATGRVYIDEFGDRVDDHQLLDMVDLNSGKFVPVANYFGYRGMYEEIPNSSISWPGVNNTPPRNEPVCWFTGDNPVCHPEEQPNLEIAVGVVIALLFLLAIVGVFVFRKIKEESKLSSMDWVAIWNEVSYNNNAVSGSRMDRKGSTATTKSRASTNFSGLAFDLKAGDKSAGSSVSVIIFRGNLLLLRECQKQSIELTREVLLEVREVRTAIHENLLRFIGAIVGPDKTAIISELCAKGNLQNLLSNEAIKLDDLFKSSLIMDIMKGMIYLQSTAIKVHSRLNSRCCWIDSRFVLKLGDYGLRSFYETAHPVKPDNSHFALMLWKAPEQIMFSQDPTIEGDVYSFGIILQEIILREEPFAMYPLSAEEIVTHIVGNKTPPFRPKVEDTAASKELLDLMRSCWSQEPAARPSFSEIRSIVREIAKNDGQQGGIMDNLLKRMEQYAANLENLVEEKTEALLEEQRKSDQLLNQVLPKMVAEQLKKGGQVHPESYDSVTIYFSDVVGFTTLSSDSSPLEIVNFLNDLYTCFDNIIKTYDVYKVETIGDSYMCVSGLPERNGTAHAVHISRMALQLLKAVKTFKIRHRPEEQLKLRIGIHSGPCVAGVVGLTMPRYCLFGDTVNTASRMESTGEALKIQVSSTTKTILDTFFSFIVEERGEIAVKGKGNIMTYWLQGET